MTHIDFQTKSDRELLILVAQASNETVDHLAKLNNKILEHEERIIALEIHRGCGISEITWQSKLKANWQTLSLLTSILALIAIKIAEKVNWW